MRKKLRKRRGTTLSIMAALLVPALGVCALTMDLGLVYALKAEMQRAADAAVLAGAQEFITGGSVETYVRSYLEKNPVGNTVATVEQLVIDTDSARVNLTIGYHTRALLLAPNGMGITVQSAADGGAGSDLLPRLDGAAPDDPQRAGDARHLGSGRAGTGLRDGSVHLAAQSRS